MTKKIRSIAEILKEADSAECSGHVYNLAAEIANNSEHYKKSEVMFAAEHMDNIIENIWQFGQIR